jgi:hypothetical protein
MRTPRFDDFLTKFAPFHLTIYTVNKAKKTAQPQRSQAVSTAK